MDFNQLLTRMQELDSPAIEGVTQECGMDMPPPPAPNTPPPSMSVNVNAQGMDNIESMLGLIAKLNGAGKADMPSMSPMPAIMPLDKMLPPKPDMDGDNDFKIGGELDSMDLPKDHDKDHAIVKTLDKDNDGDHDVDDHAKEVADTTMKATPGSDEDQDVNRYPDGSVVGPTGDPDGGSASDDTDNKEGAEVTVGLPEPESNDSEVGMAASAPKDDDEAEKMKVGIAGSVDDEDNLKDDIAQLLQLAGQKLEAYMNEPGEVRKNSDFMNNKLAGGMNRPKDTHPKVADADNPMQKVKESEEGTDLRSQIRAELAAKLAEVMGAK